MRCQRIAEKRRYRARHWETAVCKGCGREFERTTGSKRKQLYCNLKCQADSRSAEYERRPDILANAARASAISRGKDMVALLSAADTESKRSSARAPRGFR